MRLDQADRIMLGDREVSRVYLGANMVWGGAFSPASLFAQGEHGVWYDPSDFSTMFQDPAGAVPVTAVDQPVGLMLDKSKGLVLGPELKSSGTVGTVGTATSANYNSASGEGAVTRVNVNNQSAVFFNGLTASGFHKVVVSNNGSVGMNIRNRTNSVALVTIAAGSTATAYLLADATFNSLVFCASTEGTATFTVISVRELPGNHAYQPTATARPIYRASPARIDFDAVDDALITTFTASLGSNCTLARAVPGVGAQILTGQTVGTTFSDTTDHAGLVIINRALTPSETAALTVYLNAKAAA